MAQAIEMIWKVARDKNGKPFVFTSQRLAQEYAKIFGSYLLGKWRTVPSGDKWHIELKR